MTITALSPEEREVVRRALGATFQYFDADFQTRLGITQDDMHDILRNWEIVDDTPDDSDVCLAINNAMNDLLNGIGIPDKDALSLTGADRAEMHRIYKKWAKARGWAATGLR